MSDDETTLLTEAQRGDPAALERLVLQHQAWVRRLMARLAPMSVDPDDLAQEVFVVVLQHLDRFDAASGGFRAWVCAIARNISLRAWESARVRKAHWAPLVERAVQAAAGPAEPHHRAAADRVLRALNECLAELAPPSRELVSLRYHDQLACDVIARRLNRNPSSLRMALTRIRAVLRQCLGRKDVRHGDSAAFTAG